jgi:SAM-dependent methyltransferase
MSDSDFRDEIGEHVARLDRKPLRVLDAGAGRDLRLKFPPDVRITGIDISEESLRSHTALSERIVGDLQTYPLAAEAFDVVICWNVLEHLDDPLSALSNMSHALAKGGLLVIGGPNFWSPKALLAKFTPHRFHVFVYRRVLHLPHAGEPDYPPFPTYLRLAGAPKRLAKASVKQGLEVIILRFYSGANVEPQTPLLRLPWIALTYMAGLLSFGAHMGDSDFCLLLRKSSS